MSVWKAGNDRRGLDRKCIQPEDTDEYKSVAPAEPVIQEEEGTVVLPDAEGSPVVTPDEETDTTTAPPPPPPTSTTPAPAPPPPTTPAPPASGQTTAPAPPPAVK